MKIPHSSASLYVGDLAPDTSESHLLEVFKEAGPLVSIIIRRDTITRRSLGYAYVNYNNSADAEKALDSFNGVHIRGKPCRVMYVQQDPTLRKSGVGNLFIKNLDKSIDHKQLLDTFSVFGRILSCKVALDEKLESKGFAFCHFANPEDAAQAIEKANGMELAGKVIYVAPFIPRKSRSPGSSTDTFTNVYLKNFPETWTEEKISAIFGKIGVLKNVFLARQPDGKSKQFAFVNFEKHEDAVKSTEVLNNVLISNFDEEGNVIPEEKKEEKTEGAEAKIEVKADTPAEAATEAKTETTEATPAAGETKEEAEKTEEPAKTEEAGKTEEAKPEATEAAPAPAPTPAPEGKRLYVARFQKRTERQRTYKEKWRSTNLYVKNIGESITEEKLNAEFAPFGTITSSTIMTDEKAGSRGFGFVCYSTPEEAERAVGEMNGKLLGGKPLYVALAQRKEERTRQLELHHNRKARGLAGTMYPQVPSMYYGAVPPQYMAMRRGPGWGGPAGYGAYTMVPPGAVPRGAPRRGMPAGMPGRGAPVPGAPAPTPVAATPAATPAAPVGEKLTIATLSRFPVESHTQILGERLYPLIHPSQPGRAGKITGMLLERYKNEPAELIALLDQPQNLESKVAEAVSVLDRHYGDGEN